MKIIMFCMLLYSFLLQAFSHSSPVFSHLEKQMLSSVISNEQAKEEMIEALENGDQKKIIAVQHRCLADKQLCGDTCKRHDWSALFFVAFCFCGVGCLLEKISHS